MLVSLILKQPWRFRVVRAGSLGRKGRLGPNLRQPLSMSVSRLGAMPSMHAVRMASIRCFCEAA